MDMHAEAARDQDVVTYLNANLEDRILVRDQVGASCVFYDLLREV